MNANYNCACSNIITTQLYTCSQAEQVHTTRAYIHMYVLCHQTVRTQELADNILVAVVKTVLETGMDMQ